MDGTLCEGKAWRKARDVLEAKPIQKTIDRINRLYKTDFIVIYTARQNFLMSATFEWLNKHNVKFHAVSNRKIHFDYIIDDVGKL